MVFEAIDDRDSDVTPAVGLGGDFGRIDGFLSDPDAIGKTGAAAAESSRRLSCPGATFSQPSIVDGALQQVDLPVKQIVPGFARFDL